MRSKPQSCVGCSCFDHGRDFSAVEGTGVNGVMLVGEASGEMEQRDQLPFRPFAAAGGVLERCLRRMGLDRKQFSITNCGRCRPRKNWMDGAPWEYSALRHCRPNLDAAIAQYRPRCIVALGGVALRELTGEAGEQRGVTHLAGYVLPLATQRIPCTVCISYDSLDVPRDQRMTDASCDQCHGTGYITKGGAIPVLADFHPSYLRRGKASHQGVFSRILNRALNIAAGRDRQFAWEIDPDDCSTWNIPAASWASRTEKTEKWCSCVVLSQDHDPVIWEKCPECKGTGTIYETKIIPAGSRPASKLNYWTNPTLDQARSFYLYLRDNPRLPFAKDIETSESSSLDEDAREGFSDTEIRLAQFSYQPGTGIAMPYVNGFKQVVQDMMELRNPSYGHNWDNFDHKVLRACAAREGWKYAPTNRVYDTLDMFHHWQPDLPAHLQFCSSFINFPFPWKHLAATNIEFYGIADVDSDLQLGTFLESVLKKDNLWGEGDSYSLTYGYTGQEREVRPVLAAMEDRGMPIDDNARLKLGAEFTMAQRMLGAELAERAPEACRRVHPKEGYKGVPPEVKAWLKEHADISEFQQYDALFLTRFQDPKPVEGKEDEWEGEWYTYQRRTFGIDSVTPELTTIRNTVERWCRVYDFNPNSSQQLLAYMKAKGHKVPKSKIEDAEGNQKDTTAKKELTRLAHKTNDPFYLKVIDYRELTKMRGTYVEGFRPGLDGRVHSTFTFGTGTGQLSSRNPNSQNIPAHAKLAEAFGRVIAAPAGQIITKWDYRAFHVLTTGFEAECADWMRLARLDMHSFVAGEFLKVWKAENILHESDEELLERFAWFKSDPKRKFVRDKQAKPADLGIGFGEGPRRVYLENMEYFESEKQVKNFHAVLRALFKPVFDWQERIQMKAHKENKLVSKFGHVRRFYEVFRWDNKKNDWGHGDQAEEAIAFLPANHAHCHMREVKKALGRLGLDSKYGLMNEVHDSYWFCYPQEIHEEHLDEVAKVLRAPSRVLNHPTLAPVGLWCDVEAASGPNITDVVKDKLPSAGTGNVPMGAELPAMVTV